MSLWVVFGLVRWLNGDDKPKGGWRSGVWVNGKRLAVGSSRWIQPARLSGHTNLKAENFYDAHVFRCRHA